MKFLPLIWKNLMRKKIRSFFTLASIFVAFVLFALLSAFENAMALGIELAGLNRMLTIHKVSLIQPLPISYKERIESVEGVQQATHGTWFGGVYQDPKNQFAQMAVDPEGYLNAYPEFLLPEEQKQAWMANRIGAIAGRKTAERFGWKIGDRIPIQGTIWQNPNEGAWEFVLEGIYDGAAKGTDMTQFLFHREYLAEAIPVAKGIVGWYIVTIDDPDRSAQIAEAIDDRFANSQAETKTTTEKAFVQSFANQLGNISKIVFGVLAVVFFTLLLVAGNTMAQSVRERIGELGVLKTLGFTDGKVVFLVLAESLFLAILGGATGLLLVWALTKSFELGGTFFPVLEVPNGALLSGGLFVLLLGFIAGAIPAIQAQRLKIVDALRKVG